MMTLLMVLFIVLFAISQVDQKKFAALKTGLSAGFGAPVDILPGADALLDPGGAVAPDSVNISGSTGGAKANANINPQVAQIKPEVVAALAAATAKAQVEKEVKSLDKARQELKKALVKAGVPKGANFRYDERGLVVSIATDNVLFISGSARLQDQGRIILNALGPTLFKLPNRLSVDGHTDSIPISTAQFPSNWDLSSGRANGVLRYLHNGDRLPYDRMSSTGYADTKPRDRKDSSRARTLNRRVEIVVLARVDNSLGRAVAELGNQTK
jgi:chemotaxis protein MotB